jgi:hypothetical protein
MPISYARHNGQVIGAGVSNEQFSDLWTRLANKYKTNSKVVCIKILNNTYITNDASFPNDSICDSFRNPRNRSQKLGLTCSR